LQAEGITSRNTRTWSGVFCNTAIELHIFISFPASVASGKRTVSMVKQVKNCYRSPMGQDRLNGFTTLNINCDLA
jgi:hypothetical protein